MRAQRCFFLPFALARILKRAHPDLPDPASRFLGLGRALARGRVRGKELADRALGRFETEVSQEEGRALGLLLRP